MYPQALFAIDHGFVHEALCVRRPARTSCGTQMVSNGRCVAALTREDPDIAQQVDGKPAIGCCIDTEVLAARYGDLCLAQATDQAQQRGGCQPS